MGVVYRAHDTRLGRDVAIKVLASAFSADSDRLQRFEQEARAAASLNHPNILAVYDVGHADGAPFIVSELLEGKTLREYLNAGPLPIRKALDYAVQTTLGLTAAHEKFIVHRDLKPENLFVTEGGRLKILDFGLAKLKEPEAAPSAVTVPPTTQPGLVLGTAGYMAPEQVRGFTADHRSDIFSFGAILYEMLTGHRAFSGETVMDTMSAILNEDPPDLLATVSSIPAGLARVVHRCLEKSPTARFQTASDLAFALQSLSTIWVAESIGLPPIPDVSRHGGAARREAAA
jgi:serine/threonine protein kinase